MLPYSDYVLGILKCDAGEVVQILSMSGLNSDDDDSFRFYSLDPDNYQKYKDSETFLYYISILHH